MSDSKTSSAAAELQQNPRSKQATPAKKIELKGRAIEIVDTSPAETVLSTGSAQTEGNSAMKKVGSDAPADPGHGTKKSPAPPVYGFLEPTTELAKRYFDDVQRRVLVSGARQPK
jgi:hypothetical protein